MTKKEAWIHVGLLIGAFAIAPIMAYNFGGVYGGICFAICFFTFCYRPIKKYA